MSSKVTVITPSLLGRGNLLQEAIGSVARQTHQPAAHVIGIDYARIGPACIRNELAAGVQTPWIAFLDDDDIFFPNHLQVLTETAQRTRADVVYSLYSVDGRVELPPHECNPDFARYNCVPVTVLVRAEVFRSVGGFPLRVDHEDWGLWRTLHDAGHRFACAHETTWQYRFFGGNRSRIGL